MTNHQGIEIQKQKNCLIVNSSKYNEDINYQKRIDNKLINLLKRN